MSVQSRPPSESREEEAPFPLSARTPPPATEDPLGDRALPERTDPVDETFECAAPATADGVFLLGNARRYHPPVYVRAINWYSGGGWRCSGGGSLCGDGGGAGGAREYGRLDPADCALFLLSEIRIRVARSGLLRQGYVRRLRWDAELRIRPFRFEVLGDRNERRQRGQSRLPISEEAKNRSWP